MLITLVIFNMSLKLFLITVAFIFSFLPNIILASAADKDNLTEVSSSALIKVPISSESASLQTDHYANVFERLKERITLFLKFSNDDKANYLQELADKRLGELVYIMTTGEGDPIEELSSRYATHIGRLAIFVTEKKTTKQKESLLQMYSNHLKVLNNIQQNFEFESGWWLLLQHDINTVKMSQDKLK